MPRKNLTNNNTYLFSVFTRPAQDPVAKLVIDPEVDEEVGEVVDVDEKVEVAPDFQAIVNDSHDDWSEGQKRNKEQHCSDLDHLHVTFRLRV